MRRSIGIFLSVIIVLVGFGACTSYESLVNYNDSNISKQAVKIDNYAPPVIEPKDILSIRIASPNAEALEPFTLGGDEQGSGSSVNDYLVDSEGNIDLPTLGKIRVEGKTTEEAKQFLLDKLDIFFENRPLVKVRLNNFSVTVHGEVRSPRAIAVRNERITAIEAITIAGDFTVTARRDSVLVMREVKGERTFGYLNFHSTDIFSSPYFYLKKNDVLYIKPAKNKLNTVTNPASRIIPFVSVGVSVTLLILTITRNR